MKHSIFLCIQLETVKENNTDILETDQTKQEVHN